MMYATIPSPEIVTKTMEALTARNFHTEFVDTKEEALTKIKELIPEGSSVQNGSSMTLEQIGYVELLKSGNHKWNNLKEAIVNETDLEKQQLARHNALFSDYYVGSAHAVSENGEIIIASASGSQLPHLVFTSPNIILVVGTQKITPTLEDAYRRVREYVFPLENERMKSTGAPGSVLSKLLTLEQEPGFMGRTFHILFVNETLGF